MFESKVKLFDVDTKVTAAVKYGQFVLDNAVMKDSNYYIPTDEHYLEKSVFLHSNPGSGLIMWQTPYARRLYYNPKYNFSKDVNPNARGLWFEAAKSEKKESWIKQGEEATRSKV